MTTADTRIVATQSPALQAPTMPLDRLAALCYDSANDSELSPQFRAMNTRLWVLTAHLRVSIARQGALAIQMRQLAPDKALSAKVAELDSELAGFVKIFGPEIAQRMNQVPAAAQVRPSEGQDAPAFPHAPSATTNAPAAAPADPASASPTADPDEALRQAAIAGKAEDMAGAKSVQVSKPVKAKR